MARKKRTGAKAKTKKVDFSGVQSSGRRKIPSGDYRFKITEITEHEGDAGDYWRVVSEITEGKYKGFKDYSNYSFSTKALWKLKQLLEALGIDVPESRMLVKPGDLLGLEYGASTEDEEYNGKVRSKIADVFSLDELEDSGEDSDEDEEDEDEDEEDEEEDEDEEVEDEEEEDEEEEEEEKPRRRKRRK